MAHPHVALDVQSRAAGKAERFHVGEDLRLVEPRIRPGPAEAADELLVDGAAIVVDQLDLLVRSVMSVAVARYQVEPVKLTPHVDDESEGVADPDGSRHSVPCRPVAGPDLHVTLRRG